METEQASSGWGPPFSKRDCCFQLFSATLFVGGDVCTGEVETFFVVPKILLGNGQQSVDLPEQFPTELLDWLGFFQEYDFETRFKRGVECTSHELSHMYSMLELDHG